MKNKNLKHDKVNDSVILCCGGKRCPQVYNKNANTIQIRDDDGFIITITKDQARMISDAVDIIEKESKASDI